MAAAISSGGVSVGKEEAPGGPWSVRLRPVPHSHDGTAVATIAVFVILIYTRFANTIMDVVRSALGPWSKSRESATFEEEIARRGGSRSRS